MPAVFDGSFHHPESLLYLLKYHHSVSLKARSLPVRPVHFQSILHLPTMHKAVLQHGSTSVYDEKPLLYFYSTYTQKWAKVEESQKAWKN